jgi:hypothetical protein
MHRNNPDNDSFQLVLGAPDQLQSLAGQEHGPGHPIIGQDQFFDVSTGIGANTLDSSKLAHACGAHCAE